MKKLTKIPSTPRPPPCDAPTPERITEVREMSPASVLDFALEHVSASDASVLQYSVAFSREYVCALLDVMTCLLSQDPNVLSTTAPEGDSTLDPAPSAGEIEGPHLAVIGDLHGTFGSLKRALQLGSQKYVFTGDYVDRGGFSVEILLVLLTLKLHDYDKYIILRGNHETEAIAESYSFYAELYCKYERPAELFEQFVKLFRALPICCKIGRILALHGGISRHSIEQLECLNRFREPATGSALANVLWGDPVEIGGFSQNISRGIGLFFGPEAVEKFCEENEVDAIVRSHTCVNGVEVMGKTITVFSVPQYMDGNAGGFLQVVSVGGREVIRWRKFEAPAVEAIDNVFFEREVKLETLQGKQLVAAILCGLIEIDYALPEQSITHLVASDRSVIQLPSLSEARLGRLIVDLEMLCELKEIPPLAAVGSFAYEFIADIVLVGDETLAERGVTIELDVFRPIFTAEELQVVVAKISRGKKLEKRGK